MFSKKYIFILIFIAAVLLCGKEANAAAEFTSTIRATGGNYSLLSTWEAAVQSDLTASTTVVYSGSGTGALSAASIVELFRGGTYQNITASVVATTSTQILVQSFSGAYKVLQSGDQWRKASSTANMWTVSGSGAQLGDSPIAVAECYNDWSTGLSDNLTISGWTTSATNYVKVYAPAGQRHNGWTWTNTSKNVYSGFALKENRSHWVGSSATLHIAVNDCKIDGLIINQNMQANQFGVVNIANQSSNILIEHLIIFNTQAYGQPGGQGIKTIGGGKISNTLIYDCAAGGVQRGDWGTVDTYVYNSTIINCGYGIRDASGYANHLIVKNVLAKDNSTADFYSGPGTSINYCASGDHTADNYTGANNRVSQTFTFTDETNDNFHLASSDRGARNQGTNLSADAVYPITTDIDYQTRPAAGSSQQWDIGADQNFKATQVNSPQTSLVKDGLVGYWSFNGQNMGTTSATDLSGSSNTGWLINGVKKAEGISGQGLSFDGVDDYVSVGAPSWYGTAWTWSGWVYITSNPSIGSGYTIINHGTGYAGNGAYLILWNQSGTNQLQITINTDQAIETAAFPLNSWQFVTAIKNGTNIALYRNGVSVKTGTASSASAPTGNMWIGEYAVASPFCMNGKLDEVRVYNRALSANEVGQLYRAGARKMQVNAPITYKLTDGLVGNWTFNGPDMNWANTTAEALDRSGNSNNGNVVNGAKPVIGKVGQALSFDGVDDYAVCPEVSLTGSSGFTLSAWVKLNALGITQTIISKEESGLDYAEYNLYVLNSNVVRVGYNTSNDAGGWANSTSATTLSQNIWYHVVGLWNGSTLAVYINGVQNGTPVSKSGTPYDNNDGTYVGATKLNISPFYINPLNGLIDEVRVYNRALSADEIGQLYRAGARKVKY